MERESYEKIIGERKADPEAIKDAWLDKHFVVDKEGSIRKLSRDWKVSLNSVRHEFREWIRFRNYMVEDLRERASIMGTTDYIVVEGIRYHKYDLLTTPFMEKAGDHARFWRLRRKMTKREEAQNENRALQENS